MKTAVARLFSAFPAMGILRGCPLVVLWLCTEACGEIGMHAAPTPSVEEESGTGHIRLVEELSDSIEKEPANPSLYMRRSRVYADHGEWGKAIDDYEMAELLAVDSNFPETTVYEEELRRGFHVHQIALVALRLKNEGQPQLAAELVYGLWTSYPELWRLGVESARLLSEAKEFKKAALRLQEVEDALKESDVDRQTLDAVTALREELEVLHTLDQIARMEEGKTVTDETGKEKNLLTEKFLHRMRK